MKITAYGDDALLVVAQDAVRDSAAKQMQMLGHALRRHVKFTEIVPAYNSLLVQFNPLTLSLKQAQAIVTKALKTPLPMAASKCKHHTLPACYEGKYAPDMKSVSVQTGLSPAQIIKVHSAQIYDVCFLGFIPGFTFLSQTDERLHIARKHKPTSYVPAGSIGLAGWQTGIYALSSPGGWNIIARTPQTLFHPDKPAPFVLAPGDTLSFSPIGAAEFARLNKGT